MFLETKRLMLREFTMDDLDALYEVLGDHEVSLHYPYVLIRIELLIG